MSASLLFVSLQKTLFLFLKRGLFSFLKSVDVNLINRVVVSVDVDGEVRIQFWRISMVFLILFKELLLNSE
jgi:hypothetical protein